MSRPVLETAKPGVNHSMGFSSVRHPVGSEENRLREKTGLRFLPFSEFLRDHQPSREQTDLVLTENSWRVNRWDLDRPLLEPFSGLLISGVIYGDPKLVESVAIQEAARFLAPNILEEAIETAGLIYDPAVAVFNGAKKKNEQNGIYTLREAAEKEPTDIEVYAAKATTIIGKALEILGIDSRPEDFPLSQEMTQLIGGLGKMPVEQAMELIAGQVNESSKTITNIFELKQWRDSDLVFLRRLTHAYMVAQRIDGQRALEKTLERNSLNYPVEVFSESMLNWVCSLGVDVYESKNKLQAVFKQMRYEDILGVKGVTLLEFFRNSVSKGAEAIEVINWLQSNLPDHLLSEVAFLFQGIENRGDLMIVNNGKELY